ncbi:flagellar protein FliT [Bacillus sp. OV322]|uniref:flagellar protein FliT n=1 Tax=Bacillus sp. OV322 TaxID=1882764 RepID=UPI0008E7E874|nr:flagellar protein FliT [Bacillus sp. OV322]SFC24279.1 flagellar protein FliT [Bacillus sp. OV322]
MEALFAYHTLSLKLIGLLEEAPAHERDEKIAGIQELLNQRDEVMKHISPPFSSADQELGRKLKVLDARVIQLLNEQKAIIQKDLKQLSAKKESSRKYVNPYQSLATDGMFYDKRK